MNNFSVIILAAGRGTRMQSTLPKVLHMVAGQPMLAHVVATAAALGAESIAVVVAPDMENVRHAARAVHPACKFAEQQEPLGTGHAVRLGQETLSTSSGNVLVLYGDTPLLTAESLKRLLAASQHHTVTVLGMRLAHPYGYGRLVTDEEGRLLRIVEEKDATAEERSITLCNSGVMVIQAASLPLLLSKLTNANAKQEYYLTDIIAHACDAHQSCGVVEADASEMLGVNSRAQLAEAEHGMQQRLRLKAMENGATLIAPETVFFSYDTHVGRDVTIHPHVVLGKGVTIEDRAEIFSFSHLEHTHIQQGARIGPFARLRPGAVIGENARVGNFVEIKNSTLGTEAKVNHLSYIGDASVGDAANIGAGTITCNYDGFDKYKTDIGKGAFIGSNTALVAPVTIGAGAIIGAGSVITSDVEKDALTFTRAETTTKPRWATSFRKRKEKRY